MLTEIDGWLVSPYGENTKGVWVHSPEGQITLIKRHTGYPPTLPLRAWGEVCERIIAAETLAYDEILVHGKRTKLFLTENIFGDSSVGFNARAVPHVWAKTDFECVFNIGSSCSCSFATEGERDEAWKKICAFREKHTEVEKPQVSVEWNPGLRGAVVKQNAYVLGYWHAPGFTVCGLESVPKWAVEKAREVYEANRPLADNEILFRGQCTKFKIDAAALCFADRRVPHRFSRREFEMVFAEGSEGAFATAADRDDAWKKIIALRNKHAAKNEYYLDDGTRLTFHMEDDGAAFATNAKRTYRLSTRIQPLHNSAWQKLVAFRNAERGRWAVAYDENLAKVVAKFDGKPVPTPEAPKYVREMAEAAEKKHEPVRIFEGVCTSFHFHETPRGRRSTLDFLDEKTRRSLAFSDLDRDIATTITRVRGPVRVTIERLPDDYFSTAPEAAT